MTGVQTCALPILEHYFDSIPLTEDWPNAPVLYIQTKKDSNIWVEQVKVRGWKLINDEVSKSLIEVRKLFSA